MNKWLEWLDDYYPIIFIVIVFIAITVMAIDGAKEAEEAKQDAEDICLVYPGSSAVYVMTNPERRTGKTYIPATYAWHCLLKDGVTTINPYVE